VLGPGRQRGLREGRALGKAGVVDQDVDRADPTEHRRDGVLVGDVAHLGSHLEARECVRVPRQRNHVVAERGEALHHRPADPLGATGDHDRPAHPAITGISRSICARRSG
jgi:hypothetical protein